MAYETNLQEINRLIKEGVDTNEVSDGFHTFGELYEHRIQNFITVAKLYKAMLLRGDEGQYAYYKPIWRSTAHSDGSVWDGWFILGINQEAGKQITYHLPMSKWDECAFAFTLAKAPEWDGHTSADVLVRLKELVKWY